MLVQWTDFLLPRLNFDKTISQYLRMDQREERNIAANFMKESGELSHNHVGHGTVLKPMIGSVD